MIKYSGTGYLRYGYKTHDALNYFFKDADTNENFIVRDYTNNTDEMRIISENGGELVKIEGRIKSAISDEILLLDYWGVIIDDKVYDPVMMSEGYRKVGQG